ncbi:calcium-binding protein [Sphingomonas sp. ID0503]|uniref:calcium-binding protein n=1 Tax=Sphingomonas sp. ID0503 TaxID=3399691 RepID=UPI003AFB6AB7
MAKKTGGYGADQMLDMVGEADEFRGGYGGDSLYGMAGNDKLYGQQNDDTLNGGEGNDYLDGGSGYDMLFTDAGKDTLLGGAGDDTFFVIDLADAKGDTMDGGKGVDTLTLSLTDSNAAIKFTAADPIKSVKFNGQFDIKGIEKFNILAGKGNDAITGYVLGDYLSGGAGKDTLNGSAGNDFLQGDAGNDKLDGGQDNDFIYGGTGKDVINGGSGSDFLYSDGTLNTDDDSSGGDRGTEADTLNGGTGGDRVSVGVKDVADGGAGHDNLHLYFRSSSVAENFTFKASNTFKSGGSAKNFETLHFEGGSGADSVTGGAGDDILDGGSGKDVLRGGAGQDTLIDSAGADKMYGDGGADYFSIGTEALDKDVIDGGSGTDEVWFSDEADFSVYLDMADQKKHEGLAKGDTYTSIEAFHGTGLDDVMMGSRKAADRFFGEDGDDVLNGRDGNDRLEGGEGADELTGGAGKDVFVMNVADDEDDSPYANGHWRGDTVVDFKQGDDKLQISLSDFGLGSAKAFVLTSGTAAKTAGAEFFFDAATDRLWFDADGKGGDHAAELIATFENGVNLKATDFIFG